MTREYSGDLAEPIKLEPLPLLYTDVQFAAWSKAHNAEVERRMGLLFEAHGVMRGDFRGLAWSLAFDLLCFRLAGTERRGRPKCWDEQTRLWLVLSIEEFKMEGLSVTKATKYLATVEPWRSMVTHANGARRLRDESTRLSEFGRASLPGFLECRQSLIELGEISGAPGELARKYLANNYAHDEPQNEQ